MMVFWSFFILFILSCTDDEPNSVPIGGSQRDADLKTNFLRNNPLLSVGHKRVEDEAPSGDSSPDCSKCDSWDITGCGFDVRGIRLHDFFASRSDSPVNSWTVIRAAVWGMGPKVPVSIGTLWQDVRRDIVAGARLCLTNNGASPTAEEDCPIECGPIRDVVVATPMKAIVYSALLASGECSPTSAPGGLTMNPVLFWTGVIPPGERVWSPRNNVLWTEEDGGSFQEVQVLNPLLYSRYLYPNGYYCPNARFDLSRNFTPPDWNRDNDSAMSDETFLVIESGDKPVVISARTSTSSSLETNCMPYEVDIDAHFYAEVVENDVPLAELLRTSFHGLAAHLPGLNEPKSSAADLSFHVKRSPFYRGDSAPGVAVLGTSYDVPFKRKPSGGSFDTGCTGQRYLPQAGTPYPDGAEHPDPAVRSWLEADGQEPDNTIDRPNTMDGSLDRHFVVQVYAASSSLSWDPGCYDMTAGIGVSISGPCDGGDTNYSPVDQDGSRFGRFYVTDNLAGSAFSSPYIGSSRLSTEDDHDWWLLVYPPLKG